MSAPNASFFEVSDYVNNKVLAANTAESETVPTGRSVAVVTPTADLWITRSGTAVVPSADVSDGSGDILIPAGQSRALDVVHLRGNLSAMTAISMISASACIVSIEWF